MLEAIPEREQLPDPLLLHDQAMRFREDLEFLLYVFIRCMVSGRVYHEPGN